MLYDIDYVQRLRRKVLVGGKRTAERMDGVRNMLKVSELNNRVKEKAYKESLPEVCNIEDIFRQLKYRFRKQIYQHIDDRILDYI